jgi:ribosomal protein S4E
MELALLIVMEKFFYVQGRIEADRKLNIGFTDINSAFRIDYLGGFFK